MEETDPTKMDPRDIATLRSIMAALRKPVTGCPWDLQQSFETIAPYTIEEAYEVADAIAPTRQTCATSLATSCYNPSTMPRWQPRKAVLVLMMLLRQFAER
jgi:hypothetical protein